MLDFPEMDAPPASGSRIPFRDADGEGAIVFDPARLRQAGPSLFQAPAGDAAPKGRGHAWFVRGDFGAAVLKHYRRGGAAARLSAASYLWLGEARVRSIGTTWVASPSADRRSRQIERGAAGRLTC